MEAFSFFDRYDRGYIMANDLRLAAADHGLELDAEQGQQLLWRILKPSISSMRDNQPDGATFVQFEKWLWLPQKDINNKHVFLVFLFIISRLIKFLCQVTDILFD